jgi:hypothetical protein
MSTCILDDELMVCIGMSPLKLGHKTQKAVVCLIQADPLLVEIGNVFVNTLLILICPSKSSIFLFLIKVEIKFIALHRFLFLRILFDQSLVLKNYMLEVYYPVDDQANK